MPAQGDEVLSTPAPQEHALEKAMQGFGQSKQEPDKGRKDETALAARTKEGDQTSLRSGGVHDSRHRSSRYSVSGIIKDLLDGVRGEHGIHQTNNRPALQGSCQILFGIVHEASGCQMSPPIPYATLNLDKNLGIRPSKIGSPTALRLKAVFPHKLRATCGIPQTGKAFI